VSQIIEVVFRVREAHQKPFLVVENLKSEAALPKALIVSPEFFRFLTSTHPMWEAQMPGDVQQ
jgi:hypothetical protein